MSSTPGDTSPDAVAHDTELLLRAERAVAGNGRVYAVTFEADDGFNPPCTGVVTVCVPPNPRSSCIDDGQQVDATQP